MKPSIEEIKKYVSAHIAEIHTIKDLAEHFRTTDAALKMAWKRSKETVSLGKFIGSVRIAAADSWHKHHPDALCKEIALEVGLRSLDVSSRFFKRMTGRSVRKYFQDR